MQIDKLVVVAKLQPRLPAACTQTKCTDIKLFWLFFLIALSSFNLKVHLDIQSWHHPSRVVSFITKSLILKRCVFRNSESMSLRNVLISLEILLALHLVSRLKHSLKDTANPICNQLLASLYKQSSTQALAPEKQSIIGGTK